MAIPFVCAGGGCEALIAGLLAWTAYNATPAGQETNAAAAQQLANLTQFNKSGAEPNPAPPLPDDPARCPGEGWEWKGVGSPGSNKGNWWNPTTGGKLHPDFGHPLPKGPHWGYTDGDGNKWDHFPGGRGWVPGK